MKLGEVIGHKEPDPHTNLYYVRTDDGDLVVNRQDPVWDIGDILKWVVVGKAFNVLTFDDVYGWRLHKKALDTSEKRTPE